MRGMIEKTVSGFVQDPKTGQQEKQGLKKCGEIFHLAVSVAVGAIRRFARNTDCQEGHHRGHEIESGMGGFGKYAEAAGAKPYDDLETGQADCRSDGGQGCRLFLTCLV